MDSKGPSTLRSVTDDAEIPAADAETFTLTVTDSNRAPVLSFIPEQITQQEQALDIIVSYWDPDHDDTHELVMTSTDEDALAIERDDLGPANVRRLVPLQVLSARYASMSL